MPLDERFKNKEWIRVNANEKVQFKLKTYEDVVGQQQFQLWDNEAKRYNEVDMYTKGRSERYIREVIVDGMDKNMSFSKTANDQFSQILNTLRATNQDPLKATYELGRTGTGLTTRYSVTLISAEQPQQQPEVKEEQVKAEGGNPSPEAQYDNA